MEEHVLSRPVAAFSCGLVSSMLWNKWHKRILWLAGLGLSALGLLDCVNISVC